MSKNLSSPPSIVSEDDIFALTPEFQDPVSSAKKVLFSTSENVLRMISQSIDISQQKCIFTYIGEAATNDRRMAYFQHNNSNNTIFINYIGEQIHLSDANIHHPHTLRLGALRKDITPARLFLADSNFIFFNLNALKWSDAPAQNSQNVSGIPSEDANILAYMAGQSNKNRYLILYGLDTPERDPYDLTLHTALQILWYYWYGATEKAQIWPIPEAQLQDFTIDSKMIEENLLFRKDQITGNWFHKIPFDLPDFLSDHQWITTNHDEYLSAANEDIPIRLLSTYEHLKDLIK